MELLKNLIVTVTLIKTNVYTKSQKETIYA